MRTYKHWVEETTVCNWCRLEKVLTYNPNDGDLHISGYTTYGADDHLCPDCVNARESAITEAMKARGVAV